MAWLHAPRTQVAPGVDVLGAGDDFPAELGADGADYAVSTLLRQRVHTAMERLDVLLSISAEEIVDPGDEEGDEREESTHAPQEPAPRPLFAPDTSLDGVRERLAYLGYLDASPVGPIDRDTVNALIAFQQRHNLPTSGEPDPATRAVLGRLIF